MVWAFEHESPVQFLQAALHFKPEKEGEMHSNKKSTLYSVFSPEKTNLATEDLHYVIDDGLLLRRVVWPCNQTFEGLCNIYCNYIKKHYGYRNVSVIFDGYAEDGLKSVERRRRYVDVWWGIWQRTHAQLAPLTPHPLAQDRYYGPALGQKWERFGAGNLSAPISPLLFKCADGATTLSLRFGIDQDLRISGLDGKLAAGCLRIGPAWIVFCFRCWVAEGENGGDGEVRHWVLGGGGYGPPLSLLHYLHLVAHCQSDKSGHLVPSFCAFQHNRDQNLNQCGARSCDNLTRVLLP